PTIISMTQTAATSESRDLVPPALLEPPERGRCDRAESAPLLDGYFRRLARQEACGRRVLGVLATAFLRQRGQHALGFARVGDYARERLGLSARELQSVAHVATRMATLLQVEAAFSRGELSWTQARLLASETTRSTTSHGPRSDSTVRATCARSGTRSRSSPAPSPAASWRPGRLRTPWRRRGSPRAGSRPTIRWPASRLPRPIHPRGVRMS